MSTTKITATQELGSEKIGKLLLKYAIPSIIAMIATSIYNIADSIFIGHGVGPIAIAGLAVTLPLMNLASAFGTMVGIGASSLLSIKLGQGDRQSAMAILGNVLMLNIIIGSAFGALCLIFLDPILYLFGSSPDTIGPAREYMSIILAGNIFTHIYFGLNNVLRAAGFPNKSMSIMIMAVTLNCALDALFILVFKWGVAGAAIGTVIAQVTAMVLELRHFMDKRNDLHFKRSALRLKKKIIGGILSIGMAPFLMNICASIVVIFINRALKENGGDIYIAAYGIVNRVVLIFVMIIMGLTQGMQPIIGYNYGARKFDRTRRVLNMGIACAMSVMLFGFLLSMLIPDRVAMMFTTDPTLLRVSEEGMRIVTLAFPIVGFQMVTTNFFQSIGQAHKAIFLSLTRQLLFLLPFLVILPPLFGSNGVWMSLSIADTISTIMAAVLLWVQFRKFKKQKLI